MKHGIYVQLTFSADGQRAGWPLTVTGAVPRVNWVSGQVEVSAVRHVSNQVVRVSAVRWSERQLSGGES